MYSKFSVGYFNRICYIQKVLETLSRKSPIAQAMSLPSAFETQLYFHYLVLLAKCMWTKLVSAANIYISSMQLGYAVHMVILAWN